MSVLAIGVAIIVVAVAGLAVDGTRAFIARRALQNMSDTAAVAAAAELDRSAYYSSGGSEIRLDEDRARLLAVRIIGRMRPDVFPSLRVGADGVEIAVRSRVDTTWLRLVGITSIPVRATSQAQPFPQDLLPLR